ncbi:MAG: hypothetical protein NT178_09475 [Proteobacteria bacterium]|nr:hypothetical protein [Pseudomonadota bacterium]
MSFQRVSNVQKIVPANMNMSMQENTRQVIPKIVPVSTVQAAQTELPAVDKKMSYPAPGDDCIEPALFMSLPLVCFAIKEGLIEKEGLIPAEKGSRSTVSWKKPIDILYDRDEEGLKNISKTIGLKNMMVFLKQEGIILKEGLSAEDIMLGRGYVLEKKKLLSLYNRVVSDKYNRLFPFIVNGTGVVGRNGNFELTAMRDKAKKQHTAEDEGWLMPNLVNLPIKIALDKLTIHTARIKIHGSGVVAEQSPKPFERTSGETECIIYGKSQKQQTGEK